MPTATPRIGLPLLSAGQAQKETTHNEALLLLDAAIAPVVQAIGIDTPPVAPSPGQCWIVGATPAGAWNGQGNNMAIWTNGGWRFASLPLGSQVTREADGKRWQRFSDGWHAPQTVSAPAAGTTIDNECRSALTNLITALTNIGLINS